ncbi:MAG TPA: lytic transglycosylase domain-containing protein [Streptosporangiaceae bacterium]|jgi:hypothetical protein
MGSSGRRRSAGPARSRSLIRLAGTLGATAVVGAGGLGIGGQLVFRAQPSYASSAHAPQAPAQGNPAPVLDNGQGSAGSWLSRARLRQAGPPPGDVQDGSFRRIILPDLLVVDPRGLTSSDIARLGAIHGVRNMISFDGAEISVGGQRASALGVSPTAFRSWVPLRTASDQQFWTALNQGQFVAASPAARRLKLADGASYKLSGGSSPVVTFGSAARLSLTGVDLLVNQRMSRRLGLVHQVAALISAPGMSMSKLTAAVRSVLGSGASTESLRSQQLPVTKTTPGGRPNTYLQLFRASAARYCPGLSWTVLAAIGQIESADGQNMGPSTAGALGPMQFMPATWAEWGIDGFGQTGPPDVMNPYDAVPAAARLLCADGAASGGRSLYNAIFDYNHADWYVREVLGLAAQYAANYR